MKQITCFDRPSRRWIIAGAASALVANAASAEEPASLSFGQIYKSFGVRGYEFSDNARALAGKPIALAGYMAPPLKVESPFFVLTREPLAICPFCQSDADWPVDIVAVYLNRIAELLGGGIEVAVRGRLEIGSWTDPATGFVSQLRIVDASFRRV